MVLFESRCSGPIYDWHLVGNGYDRVSPFRVEQSSIAYVYAALCHVA